MKEELEESEVVAKFVTTTLTWCDIKIVPTPEVETESEKQLRDPKDRPILRAALSSHADLFLTGDKDFLESSVKDPRILSTNFSSSNLKDLRFLQRPFLIKIFPFFTDPIAITHIHIHSYMIYLVQPSAFSLFLHGGSLLFHTLSRKLDCFP